MKRESTPGVVSSDLLDGNANPKGYDFYDGKSARFMRLVYEGGWKDWIVYRHPDGQWVSLRKATTDDWHALAKAMSAAIHKEEQLNERLTDAMVDDAG